MHNPLLLAVGAADKPVTLDEVNRQCSMEYDLPKDDAFKKGVDDDDVSDLSDDDSQDECTVSNPATENVAGRRDLTTCFHPSMVPQGVITTKLSKRRYLLIGKVASMRSLASGCENDEAPRIPSRGELAESQVLPNEIPKDVAQKMMSNATWDMSKISGVSQFSTSRVRGASGLNKTSSERHLKADCGMDAAPRLPSRTDLSTKSACVLGASTGDIPCEKNATWDIPANVAAVKGSKGVKKRLYIKIRRSTDSSSPKNPETNPSTDSQPIDSPPRRPSRTDLCSKSTSTASCGILDDNARNAVWDSIPAESIMQYQLR